ncbi:DNA-binding protein [Alloscardovia venturai]|uniref:DNA-binding protein n=1 Tax=Alloscardovia venturai TaxID=1769421 RepID=A0ABW2Y463_9BIFI
MTTAMTWEEKFEAEKKRSDEEHHNPTAGAMIGHVTSNLWVHRAKIEQVALFAQGSASQFLETYAVKWQEKEADFSYRLNRALVAEDDLVPTLTSQFGEFSMLTESWEMKFKSGEEQLFDLINDFDIQLMFITRAISLAVEEKHYEQEDVLKELYAWMREQIAAGQKFLGHDFADGLTGLNARDEDWDRTKEELRQDRDGNCDDDKEEP